jgi:tryptophan-rich sensory protein
LQNPTLAFADLILLGFSIILIILFIKKIEKKSALLLIPYLLWISFAGILNYLIAFG